MENGKVITLGEIGLLLAVCGIGAVIGIGYERGREDKPTAPEVVEQVVEAEPLNAEFVCTYHKAVTHTLKGITFFEVTESRQGWNWMFTTDNGAVWFTQTAGQFCSISQVEEEQ